MNKKIIGIIIAVAVIIVTISMVSYGNNLPNQTVSSGNTNPTSNLPSEPVKPVGRHLSVELNESMGMATKP